MIDIVTRLRDSTNFVWQEAADEIERLRRRVEALRKTLSIFSTCNYRMRRQEAAFIADAALSADEKEENR